MFSSSILLPTFPPFVALLHLTCYNQFMNVSCFLLFLFICFCPVFNSSVFVPYSIHFLTLFLHCFLFLLRHLLLRFFHHYLYVSSIHHNSFTCFFFRCFFSVIHQGVGRVEPIFDEKSFRPRGLRSHMLSSSRCMAANIYIDLPCFFFSPSTSRPPPPPPPPP